MATFVSKLWKSKPSTETPITAAELNRIEQGIVEALARVPLERVAERQAIYVTKALAESDHAAGAWPTARPAVPSGVKVIWQGDTDPGALAIAGDRWDRVAS